MLECNPTGLPVNRKDVKESIATYPVFAARFPSSEPRRVEGGRRPHRPSYDLLPMAPRIRSLVPAEAGWYALYRGEYQEDSQSSRVVAWAVVEAENGDDEVVGLVVAGDEPTRIVPAPEAASAVAPEFDRYGFFRAD